MIEQADHGSGTAFVCGSNPFVETATQLLLAAGFDAARIKTERFGPTG
jgi:ferredoxin-NADP reductase